MAQGQGAVDFTLGGHRIRLQLNPPPNEAAPSRPLGDWTDDDLRVRVGQIVADIDALEVELRQVQAEQKRRRSA